MPGAALAVAAFILLGSFAYGAAPDAEHWQGIYSFDEESLDTRTSYWFHLEVKEIDGKLIGIYSEGIDGRATRRFQLTVNAMVTKAQFYFDRSLPRVEGINEPSTDSEFARGDLMFDLEERPRHCANVLVTTWHKINLADRTETGSGEDVFFKRVFE